MKKQLEFREFLHLDIGQLKTDAQSLCQDASSSTKPVVLKAYIDATHSGRLTNLRVYPGRHMKNGADSFIKPVGKPVLKHHKDEDDPIGRVFSAEYIQLVHGPAWEKDYLAPSEKEGSGYIKLGVDIMDADSIQKILDGRFRNVSTRQSILDLTCSICGDNMNSYDSECSHSPGQKYTLGDSIDGQSEYLCYGITGPLSYKEVSLVNIPGDAFAEIKSMSLEKKDSQILDFYDPVNAKVKTLVLTDGETEVDLLAGLKSRVTANERKLLTGKTVVAVSPLFDASKNKFTKTEETSMTKVQEENNKNIANAASVSDSNPAQATSTNNSQEGVVAPKNDLQKVSTGNSGLSETDSLAVVKSLTSSLQVAEAEAKDAKAEAARLQTALKDKEGEIETLRKQLATQNSDIKNAYATVLINSQLFLKKSIVSPVKDLESYNNKLADYAGRSVESLKDSVRDLSVEMLENKDFSVLKTTKELVADKKIESPAANTNSIDSKSLGVADISKEKALETFFN